MPRRNRKMKGVDFPNLRYIHAFYDRHDKLRIYYRRNRGALIKLPHPDDADFMTEYNRINETWSEIDRERLEARIMMAASEIETSLSPARGFGRIMRQYKKESRDAQDLFREYLTTQTRDWLWVNTPGFVPQ